jgi:F0F1-type ATP synthase assembly protein I
MAVWIGFLLGFVAGVLWVRRPENDELLGDSGQQDE